jgi:hypothetical protein
LSLFLVRAVAQGIVPKEHQNIEFYSAKNIREPKVSKIIADKVAKIILFGYKISKL